MEVQAADVQVPRRVRREAAGIARVEAELRLRVTREDRRVRVGVDARPDAQQYALRRAVRDQRGELLDVLDVVDHDPAHAGGEGRGQLGDGLRVAVHVDPLRGEAGLEREVQLAARGHVAAQALLREQPEHGGGRAALEANRTSPWSPWLVWSAARNARARPRRSSSAITYTGVPKASASSTASQPPTDRRPADTDEASG